MPPVSWQVALWVHLSDSHPGPLGKCLVAFCFWLRKVSEPSDGQAARLVAFEPPMGLLLLRTALMRVDGRGWAERVVGWVVLEIPPLPLGSCVMLEQSLSLSENPCPDFVTGWQ